MHTNAYNKTPSVSINKINKSFKKIKNNNGLSLNDAVSDVTNITSIDENDDIQLVNINFLNSDKEIVAISDTETIVSENTNISSPTNPTNKSLNNFYD